MRRMDIHRGKREAGMASRYGVLVKVAKAV